MKQTPVSMFHRLGMTIIGDVEGKRPTISRKVKSFEECVAPC